MEERARQLQSGPLGASAICVEPNATRGAFPCCDHVRCVTRTAMACTIKYLVHVSQQQTHRPGMVSSGPESLPRTNLVLEPAPCAEISWAALSEPAGRELQADRTLSNLSGAGVLGSEGFPSGFCEPSAIARSYGSLCDTAVQQEGGEVDTINFDDSTDDLHLADVGTLAEEIDAAFLVASHDSQPDART